MTSHHIKKRLLLHLESWQKQFLRGWPAGECGSYLKLDTIVLMYIAHTSELCSKI